MQEKQTVDNLILNNPRIRAALDRGIDDLEAGRVVSRDDANDIIEKRMEELINAREAV